MTSFRQKNTVLRSEEGKRAGMSIHARQVGGAINTTQTSVLKLLFAHMLDYMWGSKSKRRCLSCLHWQAVLDSGRAPLKPLKSARPVVWFWNEVGELLLSQLPKCRSLQAAWEATAFKAKTLWQSTDAVLDPADPLPFLGLHYMQVLLSVGMYASFVLLNRTVCQSLQ